MCERAVLEFGMNLLDQGVVAVTLVGSTIDRALLVMKAWWR
ncbi:hypothetical protein ACFU44_27045 [Nocardia rhizosphaerihabitans]